MVKDSDDYCATNRLLEYYHEDGSFKVLESKNNGFAPPPLISSSMVYNHGSLYLFGGMDHNGNASSRLYRYDLNTSAWSAVNALNPPAGRFGHSMNMWVKKKFHDDSKEYFLMIYGGCLGKDMNMQISGDLIFYCIDRNEWFYPKWGNSPELGRMKHSAFVANSKLIVFGGVYSDKKVISKFSDLIPSDTVLHIKFGTDYCRLERAISSNVVPRAAQSLAIKFKVNQGIFFGGYTNADGYSPDMSEILVVEFGIPSVIPVRLEKNCIRWDDPYNIHGGHSYELNIIENKTNITRVVYKGNDNFWQLRDLQDSNHYTAYVLVFNSIGNCPEIKAPQCRFTYYDLVLPPHSLRGRLEGVNISLDWVSSQKNRSYVVCYRLSSQKDKTSQKDNTHWIETDVGPECILEKPVTFFIGPKSSVDIAREIVFQVKAIGPIERSIASDVITVNLEDYWKSLLPSQPQSSEVEMEEVMIEGESNPTMIMAKEEFEELAVGESIRPEIHAVKDKLKVPSLERKSSKIKIKRDFGIYQKESDIDKKTQSSIKKESDIDKTQSSIKKEPENDRIQPSIRNDADIEKAKKKEHAVLNEIGALQKRKLEQIVSESSQGDMMNPLHGVEQIKDRKDDIIPRKKHVKSDSVNTHSLDKINNSLESMVSKPNSIVKAPKPEVTQPSKDDLIMQSKCDDTAPKKISVKSESASNYTLDKTDKNSELTVWKSDKSTLKSHNSKSTLSSTSLKHSPMKEEFHPVSQRLQLKMLEQQYESTELRSPIRERKDTMQNDDFPHSVVQRSQDIASEPSSIDKIVNQQEIQNDQLVGTKVPQVNSVAQLHEMLMDSSKPMYYNLKYGADIQVLYDGDWWMARAMLYAYDKNFNLYLKIHFPAWKKDEDLYIPLKDGDRVIRDTSRLVLAKFPTYKKTQFKFDLSSTLPNGHHGVHSSEIEDVLRTGYLLKPIEEKCRFIDDD